MNSNNKGRNPASRNRTRGSRTDWLLIKRIGLRIHKYLYDNGKPVEWLAFKTGIARSSIREIIAGRSNPRILTVNSIAKGLGYASIIDFLASL